jgi:type IV pilus assembly protein PilN
MSINLIPWRAERRKKLQKDFLARMGLAAVVAVFAVVVVAIGNGAAQSGQQSRNTFLTKKIEAAKNDIASIDSLEQQRANLLARKHVIEQLQADRDQLAHVFYQLAARAGDGVMITNLEYTSANVMKVEGRAVSNSAVAQYARNLEKSVWVAHPDIMTIKAKDGTVVSNAAADGASSGEYDYTFVIQAQLANPNAPKDDDADADAPSSKSTASSKANPNGTRVRVKK